MQVRDANLLGDVMRRRRLLLGLSQGAVAARIGVSRQWIAAVEQGKPRAEIGLVLKAMAALGLSLTLDSAALTAADRARVLPKSAKGPLPAYGPWNIDINAIVEEARKPRPWPSPA